MSMNLMAKAMGIRVGNPLRKLVLIKLADNANDQGECWPSYQHVADQCEIGRSTVKSHIRALEKMGLLRREYRKNGELNQSNLFYLTLDNQVKKPSGKGGSGAAPGQELLQGVGQELPEGGAGAARGGRAGAAPITSHSLEPVNEPITSENATASSGAMKKQDDLIVSVRPDAAIQSPKGDKWGTADDLRAAQWIFGKVQDVAPAAKKPNWAAWANDIRLMRGALKVTHREICQVFTWANADHFWQTNILCPAKLREKWPTLTAQMLQPSRQRVAAPHWNSPEAWEDVL
ncbi:helix-turn-helix domain-containing protein [Cronobacter sakazakii]|uniref:helix-turn-helix domain-containing protein n=2 Tax=Cronobacter sakazakii TaxID=28141 RepID=UPI000BE8234C|nr:helix-turn-helix domain-containing protein [Cronobacter sakazakii]ELY6201178.1 helix-turn-helix domain-containing protein [Cronobacter sakazakii]EMD7610650.1 helix-turn-helix domain-containing protein [Cronobacter sakazakii]NCH92786.1 helix-turn-helix domain-containing protein [Cronobacter sakazakii]NHV91968.1 helix-turn-helix domain-containing protein [Cronobacter sakazakii]PQV66009.1 helix-turn-helix domain-containing protein [Cronobacter sakazakii]